jgi:hypothetical protein
MQDACNGAVKRKETRRGRSNGDVPPSRARCAGDGEQVVQSPTVEEAVDPVRVRHRPWAGHRLEEDLESAEPQAKGGCERQHVLGAGDPGGLELVADPVVEDVDDSQCFQLRGILEMSDSPRSQLAAVCLHTISGPSLSLDRGRGRMWVATKGENGSRSFSRNAVSSSRA